MNLQFLGYYCKIQRDDIVYSFGMIQKNMGLDALVLKMRDNIQYLSILKNFVDTVKDGYDYIIIDCPPANNLITRSAFLMSDYYIIPTVLDGLSTNGVIHYINEIEATYNRYCEKGEDALLCKHFFGNKPELVGIFYNLIRGQVNYDEAKADFEMLTKEIIRKIQIHTIYWKELIVCI